MSKILNICGLCLGHGYTDKKEGVVVPIKHYPDCRMNKFQKRTLRHIEKDKKCATCGEYGGEEAKLMTCSGCMLVFYCSVNCQKSDWKKHKVDCKK